jgi:hypothetical protein
MATPEDQSKALEHVDAMHASPETVVDFTSSVKQSLLFQYNWHEMVSAGPIAINLIGSCYVACASSIATTITLDKPATPFKHLT